VGLLLLFLHKLSLFALSFETTSAKGLSSTSIVFEDWPVIKVGEGGDLVSNGLTVVLDSLGAVVLEQIENFQSGHFHEDFLKAGLVVNFVILEVNYFYARALQETTQVMESSTADVVVLHIESDELGAHGHTFDLLDAVVGDLEGYQINHSLQAFHLGDDVFMDVQSSHLGAGFQTKHGS